MGSIIVNIRNVGAEDRECMLSIKAVGPFAVGMQDDVTFTLRKQETRQLGVAHGARGRLKWSLFSGEGTPTRWVLVESGRALLLLPKASKTIDLTVQPEPGTIPAPPPLIPF